jgi:hypothetical protein
MQFYKSDQPLEHDIDDVKLVKQTSSLYTFSFKHDDLFLKNSNQTKVSVKQVKPLRNGRYMIEVFIGDKLRTDIDSLLDKYTSLITQKSKDEDTSADDDEHMVKWIKNVDLDKVTGKYFMTFVQSGPKYEVFDQDNRVVGMDSLKQGINMIMLLDMGGVKILNDSDVLILQPQFEILQCKVNLVNIKLNGCCLDDYDTEYMESYDAITML